MPRSDFSQKSFLGGEWSPFSQGRSDTAEYSRALKVCENYMPLEEGCLTRRPGFFILANTRDPDSKTRLIPFRVSNIQAYGLEFTHQRLRFYKSGVLLHEAEKTVTNVTSADPAVFTVTGHGYSDGDLVTFYPAAGTVAAQLRGRQFLVSDATTDTFTITQFGTKTGKVDGALLDDLGDLTVARVYELASPFESADLPALKYAQTERALYLFHPKYQTRVLTRGAGDTDFAFSAFEFNDGPYLDINETVTTLTPSGTSGTITITASGTSGINGNTGFQDTDVGRVIRLFDSANNWTWARITAHTSTTVVTATVLGGALANTNAISTWRLGVFSDTSGWPSAGTFHETRFWLVGPTPNRVDASQTFRPNSFSPTLPDGTVADDAGLTYLLDSEDANSIFSLTTDDRGLVMFTAGGEWVIRASTQDDPLSPTSVQARRVSRINSADIQPVKTEKSTIFVQAARRRLIEYSEFDATNRFLGGYHGTNLARFAKHLTESGLEEIVYQKDPLPVIWGRRSDGKLVGVAYKRDAESGYTAWFSTPFDRDDQDTEPFVKSLMVLPSPDGLAEDLYLSIVRMVGGVKIETVERMAAIFESETVSPQEAFFVGDGVQFNSANFDGAWHWTNEETNEFTFYGLWLLEGESVDVVFRGADLGTFPVADGRVVINVPQELMLEPDNPPGQGAFIIARALDITFTFSSGLQSTVTPADIGATSFSTLSSHGANTQYILGENGVRYFMHQAGGALAVFTDVQTADASLTFTRERFHIDITEQIFPGDYTAWTTGDSMIVLPVPGTSYFWVTQHSRNSTIPAISTWYFQFYMLYRIDENGTIQLAGGYALRSSATGGLHLATVRGCGILGRDPYKNNFLVAFQGGGAAADESRLVRIPSINDATGRFWTATVPGSSDAVAVLLHEYGLGPKFFFSNHTYNVLDNQNAFVLPTDTGALFCCFVNKATAQWHLDNPMNVNASPYIVEKAAEYPNGFLVVFEITEPDPLTPFETALPVIDNSLFLDPAGDPAIPFADAGKDSNGDPATSANDWRAPSVYHIENGRTLVFWPRTYSDAVSLDNMGSYAKIRVYEWSPTARRGRETAEQEGHFFDIAGDGLGTAGNTPQPWALLPMYINGQVQVAARFGGVSAQGLGGRWTFSNFGQYDPGQLVEFDYGAFTAVGFGYRSRMQLLRPEMGLTQTYALGKVRRIDQAAVLFHRTGMFSIGTDFDKLDDQNLGDPAKPGRRPLFSGVYDVTIEADYDFDGEIAIEQTRPVPGTILAVSGFVTTNER